jgi:hypothetical protein
LLEQSRYAHEECAEALPDSCVGKGTGEEALADASGTEQQQVAV